VGIPSDWIMAYEKEDLDTCLLHFAQGYKTRFLTNKTPLDQIERLKDPRRVGGP